LLPKGQGSVFPPDAGKTSNFFSYVKFTVGDSRLELLTSALSRQRSEPTELITRFGVTNVHIFNFQATGKSQELKSPPI